MRATDISVADFRAKVEGHLARARTHIPHQVPVDMEDPCVERMTRELFALDEFLHDFGYEERRQESEELRVAHSTAAKRSNPSLEDAVMRIDRRVQTAVETIGVPHSHAVLLPMQADLLVDAFVQFLDFLPVSAFADDRVIPPGFASARDTTVAAIVALMRDRKTSEVRS